MKKLRSNGGYSLVYVVVAMTLILAIVGGLGLTASRNLASQQQAVDRLKARYDAAGKIEKIYGISVEVNLETAGGQSVVPSPSSLNSEGEGGGGDDWNWLKDKFNSFYNNLDEEHKKQIGDLIAEYMNQVVQQVVQEAIEAALQQAITEMQGKGLTVGDGFTLSVGEINGDSISVKIDKLALTSKSSDTDDVATIDADINMTFNFKIGGSITCTVDPNSITYNSYSVTYSDGTTEEGADT